MSIESQIENMMDRALSSKLDDSLDTQNIDIEFGYSGTIKNVERLQDYGLTSVPPNGAQVFWVCVGGSIEYPIVLKVDHPDKRKKIADGEVALWSVSGNAVHLKADGAVEITSKDGKGIIKLTPDGKVSLGNGSVELVDMLSQLVDMLSQTTVATALGPQPLSVKAQLTQLKTKIDEIKG